MRYAIVRPSSLLLKGTTNVNKFTCACEDQFGFQELEVEAGHATSKFYNARLSMTTRKFNCKNGQMERDLQKALKAETYPKILIDLTEARYSPEHLKKNDTGWFDVEARVVLSIAGTTKEKSIQAQAKRISENRFVLKGEKAIRMTEFGIEPPTAMFGLIQVDDLITFHFDLTIQVEPLVFH
ncbi:MAG: YceI family protein [Saprospiraceae bacterium]|nr:YceI family protein [Saprospiraceae bacterium]MDW8229660.1 YceI family protein [Saprospiraceae bacterium]